MPPRRSAVPVDADVAGEQQRARGRGGMRPRSAVTCQTPALLRGVIESQVRRGARCRRVSCCSIECGVHDDARPAVRTHFGERRVGQVIARARRSRRLVSTSSSSRPPSTREQHRAAREQRRSRDRALRQAGARGQQQVAYFPHGTAAAAPPASPSARARAAVRMGVRNRDGEAGAVEHRDVGRVVADAGQLVVGATPSSLQQRSRAPRPCRHALAHVARCRVPRRGACTAAEVASGNDRHGDAGALQRRRGPTRRARGRPWSPRRRPRCAAGRRSARRPRRARAAGCGARARAGAAVHRLHHSRAQQVVHVQRADQAPIVGRRTTGSAVIR